MHKDGIGGETEFFKTSVNFNKNTDTAYCIQKCSAVDGKNIRIVAGDDAVVIRVTAVEECKLECDMFAFQARASGVHGDSE